MKRDSPIVWDGLGNNEGIRKRFHHLIENGPVGKVLGQIDKELLNYNISTQMAVAEATYAELGMLDEEDEHIFTTATFYVNDDLDRLRKHAPDSGFGKFDRDDADAYEIVFDEATLRFVFDRYYEETTIIETDYERIEVTMPTDKAYLKETFRLFNERS